MIKKNNDKNSEKKVSKKKLDGGLNKILENSISPNFLDASNWIHLQGVKTHNLRDIDVSIPKNKIVTITGVSGSGKSSLAFDTVYKEGQFRYIESLSSYLRQFFNLGSRPELDSSSGLSPAIAIEQNKRVGNARSTVGTLTEIDDYLRLLFAKLGEIYCYGCDRQIKAQTIDQIIEKIQHQYGKQKIYLVQEAGKFATQNDFLKFVKKNRIEVENSGGFTRFLAVVSQKIDSKTTKTQSVSSKNISNVQISGLAEKSENPSRASGLEEDGSLDSHMVEYFYLESPNIAEKFFPISVYGIFDRITIEEKKIGRLKEDLIKILSRSSKFGVYSFNEDLKQDRDNPVGKSLDKDVYKVSDAIQRFTDKNFCASCNISYPDFTTQHFSPNRQEGACEACHGLGEVLNVDFEKILDGSAQYSKAILPWRDSVLGQTILQKLAQKYSMDVDMVRDKQPDWFRKVVLDGDGELIRIGVGAKLVNMNYKGVQDVLTQQYNKGLLTVDFQAMMDLQPCKSCNGAKLRKESLHVFLTFPEKQSKKNNQTEILTKLNIYDFQTINITKLVERIENYKKTTTQPIELVSRIGNPLHDRAGLIEELGLGYISLNRQIDTLSGGEIQRLRLAKQLGNKLTGIVYVLDEPTIGLDTEEINKTILAINRLRDIGNSIIVVEHNDAFIKASDWVIEIGPGAGDFGGNLIFSGPYDDFIKQESLTSRYITGKNKVHIDFEHRPSDDKVYIKKASKNNLQNIDVTIELGSFTIITGPSGAGKTTLMYQTLYKFLSEKEKFIQSYIRLQLLKQGMSWTDILSAPIMKSQEYEHLKSLAIEEFHKHVGVESIKGHSKIENVIYVDQSSIGKTPRSCPATFIGVFDNIRKIFAGVPEAQFMGFNTGHFSFNSSKGACTECEGYGYKKVELQFLPDTYIPCPLCAGKRYKPEILSIQWHGKNIAEILNMYVSDALEFFEDIHFIKDELQLLSEIGLGYVRLGQPAHTLSGGESQRLKLTRHLLKSYRGHTVYFLDEPTVGLHPHDIEKLLKVMKKFLDNGDTILMIEHDKSLLKFADNVITLADGKIKK